MQFDKVALEAALSCLPLKRRVAFAASCCERLLPNYRAFALVEQWGAPQLLQEALNTIWAFLDGADLPETRINELVAACRNVIPDTGDFGSIYGSMGLDAALSIVQTLDACRAGDMDAVAEVAQLSLSTVEIYLGVMTDPDTGYHLADPAFCEWVWSAPLFIAEQKAQQRDLAFLEQASDLNHEVLLLMRRRSSRDGVQPFARGLVKAPERSTHSW